MNTETMKTDLAGNLVQSMGREILKRLVVTKPVGDWPGGLCHVTEVNPDPAAPEIVMFVRLVGGADEYDETGVFNTEEITVFHTPPLPPAWG